MDINQYFRRHKRGFHGRQSLEELVCADGTHLSVQASGEHYCSPSVDGAFEYEDFDARFYIDSYPEYLVKFSESGGQRSPNHDRCCHVPPHVINKFIEEHGGLDKETEYRSPIWSFRQKEQRKFGMETKFVCKDELDIDYACFLAWYGIGCQDTQQIDDCGFFVKEDQTIKIELWEVELLKEVFDKVTIKVLGGEKYILKVSGPTKVSSYLQRRR